MRKSRLVKILFPIILILGILLAGIILKLASNNNTDKNTSAWIQVDPNRSVVLYANDGSKIATSEFQIAFQSGLPTEVHFITTHWREPSERELAYFAREAERLGVVASYGNQLHLITQDGSEFWMNLEGKTYILSIWNDYTLPGIIEITPGMMDKYHITLNGESYIRCGAKPFVADKELLLSLQELRAEDLPQNPFDACRFIADNL